jgi:hypothetical protein
VPHQRIGIMGSDHASGEGGVGQVLAVSVGGGVRKVGNSGKRKAVNGRRRLAPFRAVRLRAAGRLRLRGGTF